MYKIYVSVFYRSSGLSPGRGYYNTATMKMLYQYFDALIYTFIGMELLSHRLCIYSHLIIKLFQKVVLISLHFHQQSIRILRVLKHSGLTLEMCSLVNFYEIQSR